jgi:hypothetical protein
MLESGVLNRVTRGMKLTRPTGAGVEVHLSFTHPKSLYALMKALELRFVTIADSDRLRHGVNLDHVVKIYAFSGVTDYEYE